MPFELRVCFSLGLFVFQSFLDKLLEEVSRTQEKVSSREKYINSQLEHLITDYRNAQSRLSEVNRSSSRAEKCGVLWMK